MSAGLSMAAQVCLRAFDQHGELIICCEEQPFVDTGGSDPMGVDDALRELEKAGAIILEKHALSGFDETNLPDGWSIKATDQDGDAAVWMWRAILATAPPTAGVH